MDHAGDPGLLGPDSVSWTVIGDVAAFIGGIRGLLVQAAHPEVVAGVGDHSRYRDDPLGRLSRTSAYVTATTYGAMAEVEAAVQKVNDIHRHVRGVSSRGIPYSAEDPPFAAWVHNALTDSFLTAHLAFGGIELSASEADRFVSEQQRVGSLLGADPMPDRASMLSAWIEGHPGLATSPEMRDAVAFIINPPLDASIKTGYVLLRDAAMSTIPDRVLQTLELERPRLGHFAGKTAIAGLRWALGYSPTWELALHRSGAEVPEGLFTQPSRVA